MFRLTLRHFFILFIFLNISCNREDSKVTYSLNVTVSPPGSGNVSPTSAMYEEGDVATILASPNEFFVFKNWSGDWFTSTPEIQIQITMDSNKRLVANFEDNDSDDDKVINSIDECPNTPQGASVNIRGCSDNQIDIDGDGIFLVDDLCPNTPTGKIVDQFGCPDVLFLASNGITIKASENASNGSVYIVNGQNIQ